MKRLSFALALCVLAAATPSSAACMNKFLARSAQLRQEVTLLTGTLTFQEAQELASAIDAKKAPRIEWLDETSKKPVAEQFGALKILRPMPVGCGGKASGVVMTTSFVARSAPAKKMIVRLTPALTVEFEQQ